MIDGAVVARSLALNGSAEIHYDTALRNSNVALQTWGLAHWRLVSN
jgi:hypothetical protein